jgi:recA bacterial DNA recombination protein
MKPIEMTYCEFYNKFKELPDKDYYVKTHNDELTKINAVVEKEAKMFTVTFDTGYTIDCADTHAFMDKNSDPIFVKDLKIHSRILSTNGILIVTSIKKSKATKAYDISIDYPHWYINDNQGIIHHNTSFGLLLVKAYMDKYPESALIFYDSEFGTPQDYFTSFGIDTDRVLHTPITSLEELKFDVMQQLDAIERGNKIIIVIDSIGNLASKREIDNAMDAKSTADMTRAKEIKSLFRMITPKLTLLDIPMIAINHIYQSQETFSKPVVSGGCLISGTRIKMFDDSLKNIEDIQVGDLVITLDGPKVVTHSWNPDTLEDGEPECYKITFEDGYEVICSDEHPFLINDKFVYAKELSIGDEITTIK